MNYRIKYSDELYHHGVKGMKWGVRNQRSVAGGLRRGLAGVYGMNERFYRKTGNKTLASMNAQARNRQLKKAAEADARAQDPAVRKARAKRAAVAGATVAAAALSIYGVHKYKSLKNEMGQMNSSIKFGQSMVEGLYRDNKSFRDKSNPALSSSITYLGNDFKYHTATKTANSFENLNVNTQKTFNTVKDYAKAKKRYTGHY